MRFRENVREALWHRLPPFSCEGYAAMLGSSAAGSSAGSSGVAGSASGFHPLSSQASRLAQGGPNELELREDSDTLVAGASALLSFEAGDRQGGGGGPGGPGGAGQGQSAALRLGAAGQAAAAGARAGAGAEPLDCLALVQEMMEVVLGPGGLCRVPGVWRVCRGVRPRGDV